MRLAICLLALFTDAVASDSLSHSRVTSTGIGSVLFGMTPKQAERASGVVLKEWVEGPNGDDRCFYMIAEHGLKGAAFMIASGSIARLDIKSRNIRTSHGLGVGSTEAQIRRAFGDRVTIQSHHYEGDRGWHYLEVIDPGGSTGLLFETDGNRVLSYRAGRLRELRYIEGCL